MTPPPSPYDDIIIGSGAAGLLAGCLLARAGRRVLVLERHAVLGGLMQTYRRRGLDLPTGVHALGALAPGQVLHRIWDHAGVLERLRLEPLDRDGAIEVRLADGTRFAYPWGRARLVERLRAACPGEDEACGRFVERLAETVGHFPLYNLRLGPDAPTPAMQRPLGAVLRELGASPRLRAILGAPHPFYGVDPEEVPLYVHCLVLDSFLQSAWRVDESRTPLAPAFAEVIRAAGGTLRRRAAVTRILCPGGAVAGVELADGERIAARNVLYSGHPRQLAAMCLEKKGLRPTFHRRLAAAPDTPAFFGIGLAWRGPRCPWATRDVFVYPGPISGCYAADFPRSEPGLVYASASCRPHRGGYAAVAMVPAPWAPWGAWADSRTGRRGPEYAALKARGAAQVRAVLRRHWPEVDAQDCVDVFTPLTYRDYTATPRGSAYGLSKAVSALRASRLAPVTRVDGLFLIGQSVVLPGVLGSSISSLAACAAILGRRALLERIRGGPLPSSPEPLLAER